MIRRATHFRLDCNESSDSIERLLLSLICRRLLIACAPVRTRDVDQCVEWFVRWFSVHREFDRIARQLSINNVLYKSDCCLLAIATPSP